MVATAAHVWTDECTGMCADTHTSTNTIELERVQTTCMHMGYQP